MTMPAQLQHLCPTTLKKKYNLQKRGMTKPTWTRELHRQEILIYRLCHRSCHTGDDVYYLNHIILQSIGSFVADVIYGYINALIQK